MQKKCSFPVCGAAVKLHFIVLRRAAKKVVRTSRKGALPLDPPPPPEFPLASSLHGPGTPFPPFSNVKLVTMNMWYYPACARTQYNSHFLFPISDKVLYVPRQSNCSYSDSVLPFSPSAWTLISSVWSWKFYGQIFYFIYIFDIFIFNLRGCIERFAAGSWK